MILKSPKIAVLRENLGGLTIFFPTDGAGCLGEARKSRGAGTPLESMLSVRVGQISKCRNCLSLVIIVR